MAIPSEKSPQMTEWLEQTFGRSTKIEQNKCVSCNSDAIVFRNSLSQKEYTISGLCQQCQDSVFGVD